LAGADGNDERVQGFHISLLCFGTEVRVMLKQSLLVGAALAAIGLGAEMSQATLIAYDGFDTPQGTGVTDTSGTGWAGGYNAPVNIGAGMSQGSLQTAGNGFVSTSGSPIRWFATANRVSSGSLWVSSLMNTSAGGSGGFDILNSGWSQPFSFGNNWGTTYQVAGGNTSVAINQQVFMLARIDLIADSVDPALNDANIHLWVYPASDASKDFTVLPNDAAADEIVLGYQFKNNGPANVGIGALSAIRLLSATSTSIDEIRLGTTYGDVVPTAVPEPASLSLLAGASVLLLNRRRRMA
jgi:hypothetical protein